MVRIQSLANFIYLPTLSAALKRRKSRKRGRKWPMFSKKGFQPDDQLKVFQPFSQRWLRRWSWWRSAVRIQSLANFIFQSTAIEKTKWRKRDKGFLKKVFNLNCRSRRPCRRPSSRPNLWRCKRTRQSCPRCRPRSSAGTNIAKPFLAITFFVAKTERTVPKV